MTSDYLVRGISRTNDHAALQLDLHLSTESGLITGLFASNSQISAEQSRDVEIDVYAGYVWNSGTDWRGGFRLTYYSYPWNQAGTSYNYAEINVDLIYRDSLELAVIYSPDEPRYFPYRGLASASSSSVEVNFQHAIYKKLSGIAGIGYSYLGGPISGGYEYGSAGAAYDFGHAAVSVSYVCASSEAKSLFYGQNVASRWNASIIYRF